jgi:hypothetical protein
LPMSMPGGTQPGCIVIALPVPVAMPAQLLSA